MWTTYTNKIDTILTNNPDRNSENTLNELLVNEEDLINEIKRSNPKLLDYFRDNQKIVMKLVEYISVESKDPGNVDRCFKFPLVSSEVFDCSPPYIMSQFFFESKDSNTARRKKIANCQSILPNSGDQDDDCNDGDTSCEISAVDAQGSSNSASAKKEEQEETIVSDEKDESQQKPEKKQKVYDWPVMNQLFEFLKPESNVNEVLASYWQKVVSYLISMKPQEMIEYILTSKGVLEGLFRHINNQSIESNKFSAQTQDCLKDFTETKVLAIGEFIKKFETYSYEEIQNLSFIFLEIVQKYYLIQDGKEMLEYLCNEQSVEQIFKYMVSGNDGSKNGAGQIIQSLSQYYAFNANSFISGYPEGSEYYMIMLQQYENMPFLRALAQNIPSFCEILSVKDNSPAGGRETLGVHRLKIIEIMTQVIKIQFPSIQESFIEFKVLQHILDLFFKYEWHNILHQANSDKLKIRTYLKHLLCDQKMTQQFIDQVGDTHYYFNKVKYPNRSTTKGYLGYVIKISDELEKFYQNSIKTRANGDMLEWHNEAWVNFIENTLDNHKEKGCKDLGNFDNFINGKTTAEIAPGEADMAIYREYERQQASDRMKSRQNYQDQIELQKHYEQKRAKLAQDKDNCEVILDYVPGIENDKNTSQNQLSESTNETPNRQAQPNSTIGVSSKRNNTESLSASKQNVMFVQMDSKKLDDDIQIDDDEDEVKRSQPQQEPQDQTQTSITTPSYDSYMSDNPLIREILQKYSPKKELVTNQDDIIETPTHSVENPPILNEKSTQQELIPEKNVEVQPILEENVNDDKISQENSDQKQTADLKIVEEKKVEVEENKIDDKTDQSKITKEITPEEEIVQDKEIEDDTIINQSQQEGQVNNPISNNEQDQQISSNSDLKTISHIAEDGEDLVEEESNQKFQIEQSLKNQNIINSANNLELNSDNQKLAQNKAHSSTELGEEINKQQLSEFQESIKSSIRKSENQTDINQQNDQEGKQETGKLDNNPISQSPEKPENIEELSKNTIQDENINQTIKKSERLNYFQSNASPSTSERNRSAESNSNKQLQKKQRSSHSPNARTNDSQTILPLQNTNSNTSTTEIQNNSLSVEQSSLTTEEKTVAIEELKSIDEKEPQQQKIESEQQVIEQQQQQQEIEQEQQIVELEQQEIENKEMKQEQETQQQNIEQDAEQVEMEQVAEKKEEYSEDKQHQLVQENQKSEEDLEHQNSQQNDEKNKFKGDDQQIQNQDQSVKSETQNQTICEIEKKTESNNKQIIQKDNIHEEIQQKEQQKDKEIQQQKQEQEILCKMEDQQQLEQQQKNEVLRQKDLNNDNQQHNQNQEILKQNSENVKIDQYQKEENNNVQIESHESNQSNQQQIQQKDFEQQISRSETQHINKEIETDKKKIEDKIQEIKQSAEQKTLTQQQPIHIAQTNETVNSTSILGTPIEKSHGNQIENYEQIKDEVLLKYKNLVTNQNLIDMSQQSNGIGLTKQLSLSDKYKLDLSKNKTSQEISKDLNNPKQQGVSKDTQKQNIDENLQNIIKVEKSDFKSYTFTEEPSKFNPINIELDRTYDKEEKESIQQSLKNSTPTGFDDKQKTTENGRIDPLSSISTFKYEMKYTTPYSNNNIQENNKNNIKQDETKEKDIKLEQLNVEKSQSIQFVPYNAQTSNQFSNVKPIQEFSNENSIPTLLYEENDPTINPNKKKYSQAIESGYENLTQSLPIDAFRKSEEILRSSQLTVSERNKIISSSPTQFKQQFQENLRASVDSSTINKTIIQQNLTSSVDVNSNNQPFKDVKLISSKSQNDAQLSPRSQKANYLQQSQQERMQIQQLLLQKYGKSPSNNNSPQSSNITTFTQESSNTQIKPAVSHLTPTETKNVDFANPVQAHQHYSNYIHHQPHNISPSQQLSQFSQQNLNIGGHNYNIIQNNNSTTNNQVYQRPSTGMSQEEKLSYVEQETVLLKQKLASSKDYQSVLNQIRDLQSVCNIINDDNTVLIEQRIVTSQVIRQSFFDMSEKNRINLETTIDTLEEDKQHQEKELKLQYQTEFEMIEKQMRQEQDEMKAKKKTQDFLQKLLIDRVNKLYEIHLKYSLQQRQTLEKALIEAKNLNEKLNTMHLSSVPNKQLSLQQITQVQSQGNTQPQTSTSSQQQNIQPTNQVQLQSTSTSQAPPPTYKIDDPELQKYYQASNPAQRQNHQMSTTNKQDTINKQGLAVQTVKTNKQNFEENSSSPCFGSQDPQRLKSTTLEEKFSLNSIVKQNNQNQQQNGELSPTFGSVRKNSLSLRHGSRKLSGTQTTEGDQVLEDPYEYKASSSARDKSPMPTQAVLYFPSSSSSQQMLDGSTNNNIRRMSSNAIPPQSQLPNRGAQTASQPQQNYPIVQQNNLEQQQQQNYRKNLDNYTPQSNIHNKTPEEQMSNSVNSNSSISSDRAYQYDSQDLKNNKKPTLSQNYSLQSLQNQQLQAQQQSQQNLKILSQNPVQVSQQQNIQQSYPPYGQNNYEQQQPQIIKQQQIGNQQQNLQSQYQQQQYQQPYLQQQQQQPQQQKIQQQQYQYQQQYPKPPNNQQIPLANNSYGQSQQLKQQEDQYKQISENLKLNGYYNQPVKTVQVDLSSNDERKFSDYSQNSVKNNPEQNIRANSSAVYQKQMSQPINLQQTSYGQTNQFGGSGSQEIENQFQISSNISQNRSSHNTPRGGNTPLGNTPVGSSSNLNQINSQQMQFNEKESNNKPQGFTQLNDQPQNTRYRPLSSSDIMYKNPNTHQIQESKFAKLSSPHSSSPQMQHTHEYPQYGASSFSNTYQSSTQPYNHIAPITDINDLLPDDVKQIIQKYTGSLSVHNSNKPNQQLYNEQQYTQQYVAPSSQLYQQNYISANDKIQNHGDDQYSSYDKLKNSSTNYSTYSGRSSYYNQSGNNNDQLNLSDMNELSSVNSQTSNSQYFEGTGGQNKKIKIVMKKANQQPRPPSLYEAEQMGFQQMPQTNNQQQQVELNKPQSLASMYSQGNLQSRQIQEKDKQLLNMLKPANNY